MTAMTIIVPCSVPSASAPSTPYTATHYVTTGASGGDGSLGSPWTLAEAMTNATAGNKVSIGDGTYSDAIASIAAGTVFFAGNDGAVTLTGTINPGDAGFTFNGMIANVAAQKNLGSGNTYERMSFVGGLSSTNSSNSTIGAGTSIKESAFYGFGGRYLLQAYQQDGALITIEDVIFRPDGGWTAVDNPVAGFNIYDSNNWYVNKCVMIDGIVSGGSSILGGMGVNTHTIINGASGTIEQCVAVNNASNLGRFWADGGGGHNHSVIDCKSYGNTDTYGMTRNCLGTTTATRFDTDGTPEAFTGFIDLTTGANLVLNSAFLNEARWKTEMDAIDSRGWSASAQTLSAYIESFLP